MRLWAGPAADLEAAQAEGLEARPGRMLVDSLSRETELEEITDAVLMSRSDDFNALAAAQLRGELGHGHVYRTAPDPNKPDLLPPAGEPGILVPKELTLDDLSRRLAHGAQIVVIRANSEGMGGGVPLFAVGDELVVALMEPDRLTAVPALESVK